jgi:hypothetical protein
VSDRYLALIAAASRWVIIMQMCIMVAQGHRTVQQSVVFAALRVWAASLA